ncbi:hypothetical protein [Streptomyces phaeochromogenes]|uniref:hypothetical protein n=1 Tax=Streptomyces phaeochromogenes TaxID=1923 RepID=UPI00338F4748
MPASSGNVQRHRLNRGGDRQANSALHMAVVCRLPLRRGRSEARRTTNQQRQSRRWRSSVVSLGMYRCCGPIHGSWLPQ